MPGSTAHADTIIRNANIITTQRIVDTMVGALAQAIPERVLAASAGTMNLLNVGGLHPRTGEYFQYIETYDGQLRDIALHYGLLSADDIVMISNNLYDGYGDGPAVFNTLFYDWLRQDIGFRGLIITDDLDEGPIIEQDTVRVTHADNSLELARRGADVERQVLSRAVLWHAQDRVIRHGNHTIVF